MPVSAKPFEVRRTLPGRNWASRVLGFWHFVHHPELHAIFFGTSKTKCVTYCAVCLNDLSRVKWILSCLDVQMLNTIPEALLPWTCVIPRFLTIYKNTGVTGLWRGHCATGLVIFDAKIYPTRRCCRVCLKHDKEVCCTYPSKVFFPLGMFMMFAGSKKSFQQNHGGLPNFSQATLMQIIPKSATTYTTFDRRTDHGGTTWAMTCLGKHQLTIRQWLTFKLLGITYGCFLKWYPKMDGL